ncbi:MAG TPA: GNAT family N-acetyltransferase [Solirubrobacteraceae bacterium]|nr:GNAT family N-acetyltransferase [Solirubrobacteraceae bacterium]
MIAAARNLPDVEDVRLAVVEDDGRFVACLPFHHIQSGLRSVSPISYKTATSRIRRMNYLGTPLIDPAGGLEATTKLIETVAAECRSEGSYAAELWDVAAGGPVDGYLREAAASLGLPLVVTETFDRGFLHQGDAEALPAGSAETIQNLRDKRRSLGRALGDEVVLVDRTDDEAIDDYVRLEASGYKSEFGVSMTTFPGEREFFSEMCRSFVADGRMHFLSLMAGDTTMAMVVWIDAGDSVFQFKWSYDHSFAEYSPGLQVLLAGIEHFREKTDFAMLDTCTGDGIDFVLAMYPARRTLNLYRLVVQDRLRDRMRVKFVDESRDLRDRVRKLTPRSE